MDNRPDSGASLDSFAISFNWSKKVYYVFHFVCFVVTSLMVARGIFIFMLNDDVTQVEFKEFHSTDESNYPSFTFCFTRPVLMPEQFGEFGEEYDGKEQELISNWTYRRSEYLEYLNGNLKPEHKELFANLDYDKMTHSLEDYMKLEAGLGAKRGRAGRGAEYKTYTRLRWAFPNRTQTLSRAYRQKKNDKGRKYIDNLNEEQKAKIPMVDFYISDIYRILYRPAIRNETFSMFIGLSSNGSSILMGRLACSERTRTNRILLLWVSPIVLL